MFTAEIRFSDLHAPAGLADGGIFLGDSYVRPFSHRLLRTIVVEQSQALVVACLERFPDDPVAPEHVHGDREAGAERVDAIRRHLLDWAILTVDREQGAVRYETSWLHSAPVYLRVDREKVRIDWDYARLLEGSAAEIDWEAALAHVAGIAPYAPRTMVRDLHRSIAGATLVVRPESVDILAPPESRWPGPQQIAKGAPLEILLFDTVKALIGARAAERDRTAVEISGGMDSALVALAAADVLGPGLFSSGAQFSGAMGKAQRKRRRLLCAHGGFDDLELPAGRFAAFSAGGPRRHRYGVWPEDENYPEIFEAVFDVMARAGIDTLISGFGGDELYAAYPGEEEEDDVAEQVARHPFLTDEGWQLAQAGARTQYAGPLQTNAWISAAGRSQRLLRRGIWPIYPYNSPELAKFVASLPWEHRRDRALLRRTLTARLDDPVFRDDYVKETFREVALRGIAENRAYLIDLVGRSPVTNPAYVDRDRVVRVLEGDVAALPAIEFGLLFLTLTACCFFQS